MIVPARPLLVALGAWLVLGICAAFMPVLLPAWQGTGALILLWGFADFLLARWQPSPSMQRVVSSSLPLGEWSPVEIRLHWSGRAAHGAEAFDHHPQDFEQQGLPARLDTRGNNTFVIRYRVRPMARGDHAFDCLGLRAGSPLHAWQRSLRLGTPHAVKVYPNFAPLARHALRAVDYRNASFGLQQRRRRGQGMDFAQLREYREGDSLRQIDWKATTRMGKMISREYQDERDQRILLLVDCGRRMGARDEEPGQSSGQTSASLSHFDHALDAALMLAYVALRHGDRVGLMTLGGPERFVPAQRSASTVSNLLGALYDLQPGIQTSDFERAAQRLLMHERKRALVVLLTNLRDEDDESLLAATRLLRQRHLVLVASLREAALDEAQAQQVGELRDAARLGAATGYRRSRDAAFKRLRAEGVLCLDVPPQKLAVEAINRYLAVKAAHQL
ncbi:MAG: hypothetical protein JWL63_3466 [Rhodocyclales bacterium]|nr:hypothetical protein [Rhodocyclales bacterium]